MRGWWALAMVLCLVSEATAGYAAFGSAADDPGLGAIADGVYRNDYFGISYMLPPHWRSDDVGPPPSESGYYVLGSFVPRGELVATTMIAAQDMFFARPPIDAAAQTIRRFTQALIGSGAMSVDFGPSELMIAGHPFSRVDYSGAGLHHAMLVTALRCHLLSFTLGASEPKLLEYLTNSLDQLTFVRDVDAGTPICMKDYANTETILRRVEPAPMGRRFTQIPVRIVIDADGRVGHVHVIRATPEQREAIEIALTQWRFKPCCADGVARSVETGLLFSFGAAQEASH